MHHDSTVDIAALRAWRLGRVRSLLAAHDYAGALLYDPVNIRYATDTSNMQVWTLHNPCRYALVATDGPVTLWDFHGCGHLSADNPFVDETRTAISWYWFLAGPRGEERAAVWAAEIADAVRAAGGGNRRLAVDRLDPIGLRALEREGLNVHDGQQVMELARAIKNDVEVAAMKEAIAACEEGMRRMQAALAPGITENALWSLLHQANIELGGEWVETRLLASGPRTNPWFHECSDRIIEDGDFVCFDTDLIGPNGYCADISRSWLAGGGKPNDEQRALYEIAREQIEYNTALLRPGTGFREYAEACYELPQDCLAGRYSVVAHGIGLCDEYPSIVYRQDWGQAGYDGVIEPGMAMCVESYVGREGGREGVKLEQQYLVTESGPELLSRYPLEDDWL